MKEKHFSPYAYLGLSKIDAPKKARACEPKAKKSKGKGDLRTKGNK
jgi:hypothetical protein